MQRFKNVISSFRLVCTANISVNASLHCVKNEAYLEHPILDKNSTFQLLKSCSRLCKLMQIYLNLFKVLCRTWSLFKLTQKSQKHSLSFESQIFYIFFEKNVKTSNCRMDGGGTITEYRAIRFERPNMKFETTSEIFE